MPEQECRKEVCTKQGESSERTVTLTMTERQAYHVLIEMQSILESDSAQIVWDKATFNAMRDLVDTLGKAPVSTLLAEEMKDG